MNILILTPIHPIQIAEMINFVSKYYVDENDIFSLQAMALLGEEVYQNQNQSYLPLMYSYATAVRKNPKLMLRKERNNRKNIIIYGNLDRNTDMKFDHILAYSGMDSKEGAGFDDYLTKSKELFDKSFTDKTFKPINWYTIEDAHHQFPTLRHLGIMLKTLGIKEIANDELQREATESN